MAQFLKTLAFVLVCGIVGPAFLAAYYLGARNLPETEWLFWAGWAITLADVLIAVGITVFRNNRIARRRRLEQQGVLAQAEIVNAEQTSMQVNDQPVMRLTLSIEGPGLTPFEATKQVIVPLLHLSTLSGRRLAVLVDPADNSFEIDWQRSALVAGVIPASFTELGRAARQLDPDAMFEILQVLRGYGVGPDGTVDLRNNPAARQAVRSVIRQHTMPESEPPSPARAAPFTTAQRLQELETLRATGAITEDEYTAKRAEIIAAL